MFYTWFCLVYVTVLTLKLIVPDAGCLLAFNAASVQPALDWLFSFVLLSALRSSSTPWLGVLRTEHCRSFYKSIPS